MGTPDSPDYTQAYPSYNLLLRLKSQTRSVSGRIATLLEQGAIQDETDRQLVVEAVAFIENPTENLSEIMNHTTNIGIVEGGYDMQGAETPPEIIAMHGYLFALQCINQINFIENELEQSSPDSAKIKQALALALDWATILSRGYKDHTLLSAVNELQGRLNV